MPHLNQASAPQFKGKVARPHSSNEQDFCQLLSQKGDCDLDARGAEQERVYNPARPHGAQAERRLTK